MVTTLAGKLPAEQYTNPQQEQIDTMQFICLLWVCLVFGVAFGWLLFLLGEICPSFAILGNDPSKARSQQSSEFLPLSPTIPFWDSSDQCRSSCWLGSRVALQLLSKARVLLATLSFLRSRCSRSFCRNVDQECPQELVGQFPFGASSQASFSDSKV